MADPPRNEVNGLNGRRWLVAATCISLLAASAAGYNFIRRLDVTAEVAQLRSDVTRVESDLLRAKTDIDLVRGEQQRRTRLVEALPRIEATLVEIRERLSSVETALGVRSRGLSR